jgi:Major capsid protein N-terminus/Large eukaryotic DNA virus major capsid protein
MPGGLLNIISEGNNNVFLTGNPSKTFFNVSYSKYTNFGLQKFRLDYEGSRDLRLTTDSIFKFKIKRYAELLMDTYLVVNLPDIWSPIYAPYSINGSPSGTGESWGPYDFRWIKNIGSYIVREIEIKCGNITIQKYTGEYLAALVERDFSAEKKDLYNRMSGNVPEINDPGNAYGRINSYPSAYYTNNIAGSEPSIRGRQIYIPINAWFTLDSRCAFPLICLQYNELEIDVTLRPIQELIQIRDVFDPTNEYPYVQPDFTKPEHQMYRFLQTPPSIYLDASQYENQTNTWNSDIHLIATYCFLSNDEKQLFASKEQVYLIKDIYKYDFENVTGSKRVSLPSLGMVSSWMMFLQRNDVNLRNEWDNFTNWPYIDQPVQIQVSSSSLPPNFTASEDGNQYFTDGEGNILKDANGDPILAYGPQNVSFGQNISIYSNSGYYITGDFAVQNQKNILQTMGILLNGEYRENTLTRGVFDYIEKYTRTNGSAKEGIYCYNFCLNTNPLEYQPSGAINMSKFKTIELEITTYSPQFDTLNSNFNIICDGSGNIIGVNKQNWTLYEYNYNLTVLEERYNVLSFISGTCGMLYAR